MEDKCLQKISVVTIATKVKREDRIKLEMIAKTLGMKNLYQLFQGLLLFLLRYFDCHTAVSSEHETLIKSYLNMLEAQKGSFTPLQATSKQIFTIKKGILFINRKKGERSQMLSVCVNENGEMTESYNMNEILADVMASIDTKLLDELNDEKQVQGYIGIIDTLRNLLEPTREERIHEQINKMFTEEIGEMFADLSIETFEELTNTHYKRKQARTVDGVSSYSPEATKADRDIRTWY